MPVLRLKFIVQSAQSIMGKRKIYIILQDIAKSGVCFPKTSYGLKMFSLLEFHCIIKKWMITQVAEL